MFVWLTTSFTAVYSFPPRDTNCRESDMAGIDNNILRLDVEKYKYNWTCAKHFNTSILSQIPCSHQHSELTSFWKSRTRTATVLLSLLWPSGRGWTSIMVSKVRRGIRAITSNRRNAIWIRDLAESARPLISFQLDRSPISTRWKVGHRNKEQKWSI